MAPVNLSIEDCTTHIIPAVLAVSINWPQSKRDKFMAEWILLEALGANLTEVDFIGGRFVTYPSEDFVFHMQAWGVYL
jgi:hypothetical protein